MTAESSWLQELEAPTAAFFTVFAARIAEPEGVRDAVREAVKTLVPIIDWEAYQPHFPHGILGLRAVLRLRPLLPEASFLRALATQIHMAAHEGRRSQAASAQVGAAKGSGSWRNLEAFITARKPALAYAEAQGFACPEPSDFQRLAHQVAPDMANVGHKAVVTRHLGDLQEQLERPKATGRRLLGVATWLAATPEDLFWARRVAKRLGEVPAAIPVAAGSADPQAQAALAREICDLGLVALLDRLTARLQAGLGSGDLLAALVLAAAEKQLDARRDLEGKTGWNFVYLSTLAGVDGPSNPLPWCQAAALVNLFPTDEPEERVRPLEAPTPTADGLSNAVLDGEPTPAMGQAEGLLREGHGVLVLQALAEAATRNDPSFNHAYPMLVAAAAADLVPHLPEHAQRVMLVALAKSFANSQGSGDLGRMADRALGRGA